jgi:hypothetical protein
MTVVAKTTDQQGDLMFGKIMLGGVTAAVIVGAGTAALATTGSGTTAGAPAAAGAAGHHATGAHKHGKRGGMLLRKLAHGQVVVKTKQGFVTHDLIRGTVTAVSPTSITVKSLDNTSETFAITKATKVRVRSDGAAALASITKVAKGDRVFVGGTGTSTFTAKHVIDVGTK